jgi:hypothetical protein
MKEKPTSKIHRTNFEGNWKDICPHCGNKQMDHRKTYGPLDGVIHEHRLPCEPERELFIKERQKLVRTANWLVTGIDLVGYGVSKIPFLGEIRVAKGILKHHLGHKLKPTSKNKQ